MIVFVLDPGWVKTGTQETHFQEIRELSFC